MSSSPSLSTQARIDKSEQPPHILVYSASAGSGKTYKLALNFIALALRTESPTAFRNILAVTFTNKATGEMKDRILMQLYLLSKGKADKDFAKDVSKLLPDVTPQEIARRAGQTLRHILHDYDRFHVETIDSFFQGMLTNLAHELKLLRGFKVDLDDKDVTNRAIDKLIEALNQEGLDKHKRQVLAWLTEFMRDSIQEEKGWNIVRRLKSFAANTLFSTQYLPVADRMEPIVSNDKTFSLIKQSLRQARTDSLTMLDEALQTLLEELDRCPAGVNTFSNGVKSFKSIASRIRNRDWRSDFSDTTVKWTVNYESMLKKADQLKPDYVAAAKRMSSLLKHVVELREKARVIHNSAKLMEGHLNSLRLLGEVSSEVNSINHETGRFTLAKTPYLFEAMVQHDDASFVFERAGTTFNHVMIDEFQDTSHIQWNVLRRLLVENLSAGNECILVGDVKQSIYRWRGGDWGILGNIKRDMPHADVRPMTDNFRSQGQVVAFNNAFFTKAAHALDKLTAADNEACHEANLPTDLTQTLYSDVAQQARPGRDGGYVRVAVHSRSTEHELVYDDIYAQMLRLHEEQGVPYHEMAVLVRRNKDATEIVEYFNQAHADIPIASDEAFKLIASPAIRILISTLQMLANPHDTVNITELAQLLAVYVEGKKSVEGTTPDEVRATLPPVLTDMRHKLCRMPLFELCERIVEMFQLHHMPYAKGQSAYLYTFYDKVLQFLDEHPSDISLFLTYWKESLYSTSTSTGQKDCVSVCTVHKAKGLAYHTVFIPEATWAYDSKQYESLLWCSTDGIQAEPYNALPLIPISKASTTIIQHSVFAPYYAYDAMQQRIDTLNTLYVAFTRAEQNMLIWFSFDDKSDNKSDEKSDDEKKGKGSGNKEMKDTGALMNACFRTPGMQRAEPQSHDVFYAPVVDKYILNPSPDDYNAAQTKVLENFEIWHAGQPVHFPQQAATSGQPAENDNPLEPAHVEVVSTDINPQHTVADYRQSTEAARFVSDLTDDDERQQTYIDKGKLLHHLLELTDRADDLPRAVERLQREGLLDSADEAQRMLRFMQQRLADERVAHWFDGSCRLFKECNMLLGRTDEGVVRTCRPDRVMQHDDTFTVVDFKFARPAEAHQEQVRGYCQALRLMGHEQVQGYLWYLYENKVVPVEA